MDEIADEDGDDEETSLMSKKYNDLERNQGLMSDFSLQNDQALQDRGQRCNRCQ